MHSILQWQWLGLEKMQLQLLLSIKQLLTIGQDGVLNILMQEFFIRMDLYHLMMLFKML